MIIRLVLAQRTYKILEHDFIKRRFFFIFAYIKYLIRLCRSASIFFYRIEILPCKRIEYFFAVSIERNGRRFYPEHTAVYIIISCNVDCINFSPALKRFVRFSVLPENIVCTVRRKSAVYKNSRITRKRGG